MTVYIEELINNEKMMGEICSSESRDSIRDGESNRCCKKAYHHLKLYEKNHDEQSLKKGLSTYGAAASGVYAAPHV